MTSSVLPLDENHPMKTNIVEVSTSNIRISQQNQPISTYFASNLGWIVFLAIFGVTVSISFIRSFLCICNPNEVVILAGRQWKRRDGHQQGYRVLHGGRAIRIPFLETVKRMDLTTMPVPVEVHNAYSKGGIPLHIQAIANIRISNDENIVCNAIERFLDHKQTEIVRVAKETLEGSLRGVVATLTPEQVNEDRLQFAERIASGVSRDLKLLGLQLDILKIQSVADDVDYLSSLGRKQIAMILRDAEIAESDSLSEAEKIEAECEERSNVALTQDRITIIEHKNCLRTVKARLKREAQSAVEITIAATAERKAKIEQTLQRLRTEVETLRLEAEKILPARAHQEAEEFHARGHAAIHGELANATAQVNDMLAAAWGQLGNDAAEVVMIQQLEQILTEAAKIPGRLNLEDISVVDDGNGDAIANLLNIYPQVLHQFLETVHQLLGIDVIGTLQPATDPMPASLLKNGLPD